jgi:hypothetical protein
MQSTLQTAMQISRVCSRFAATKVATDVMAWKKRINQFPDLARSLSKVTESLNYLDIS